MNCCCTCECNTDSRLDLVCFYPASTVWCPAGPPGTGGSESTRKEKNVHAISYDLCCATTIQSNSLKVFNFKNCFFFYFSAPIHKKLQFEAWSAGTWCDKINLQQSLLIHVFIMLYLICPERPELVCRLLRVLLPLAESTLGNGLGAKAVLLNTSEHANLGKEC